MSNEQKQKAEAREFWIEQFNGRIPPSYYAFKDKPSFNKVVLKVDEREVKASEYFHVIEYSAYQALEAKIADLQDEIMHWRTSYLGQALIKAEEKLRVAVEALKQIDNTSDCKFALEIVDEALQKLEAGE